MLLFPLHLAGLQTILPVLTLLFKIEQIPIFYYSITCPGKLNFLLLYSITVTKVCMGQSLMCSGGK